MMVDKYKLRIYPDAVLRQKAEPVKDMNGEVDSLIKAMRYMMVKNRGIGLAAPQVGVLQQIIIADIGEGLLSLANPVILHKEVQDSMIEGCLSLPDTEVDVSRNQVITVASIDSEGEEIAKDWTGLMARVIQHEIDHLKGILIIDHQEKRI
jgi:peptide deformylase